MSMLWEFSGRFIRVLLETEGLCSSHTSLERAGDFSRRANEIDVQNVVAVWFDSLVWV